MKLLKEITEKEILGTDGLSGASPRCASRAILKRKDGLFAVLYLKKFSFYSLPGGGIEEGEDRMDALRREVLEETGCLCNRIKPLGYTYENRNYCDRTLCSYYYYVETEGQTKALALTDIEKSNDTELQWYPLNALYQLIVFSRYTNAQQRFIQARDTAALDEFLKIIHE